MACVECSSCSLKKMEEKGLLGSNSVWHCIRFGHWSSCSSRWRFDWRGWRTRRWLCVLYWSFLWRSQLRSVDTMCEIFQMGAHTLCRYEGRFCLWALSGIHTGLFFVSILCNCIFLNSVNILCVFCVSYSPSQIRKMCTSNWGRWSL
jgi:hypothetical protein